MSQAIEEASQVKEDDDAEQEEQADGLLVELELRRRNWTKTQPQREQGSDDICRHRYWLEA
jgi:hypothetical protein